MKVYVKISHLQKGISNHEPFPNVSEMTIGELILLLEESYLKYEKNAEMIVVKDKTYSVKDSEQIVSMEDIQLNNVMIMRNRPVLTTLSQYDEPYNHVANQCSWFSFEILYHKQQIVNALDKEDFPTLVQLYHECLQIGTTKRNAYGVLPYGENIDQVENSLPIAMKTTQYGDVQMIEYLDEFVKSIILRPGMKQVPYPEFKQSIELLPNNTMVILNRDGKSFVFMKRDVSYWVFDSHKRSIVELIGIEAMNEYILEGTENGFFFIIYGYYY
jgi:hypothetical protein